MKNIKTYNNFINEGFFGFGTNDPSVSPKFKDIYKYIKKIVSGADIKFIPDYKEWPFSIPENIIKVRGKGEDKPFYLTRDGFKKIRYDGDIVLTFYLDKNFEDILRWVQGDVEDFDQFKDFMDNFDGYQDGDEGAIEPNKNRPYEILMT